MSEKYEIESPKPVKSRKRSTATKAYTKGRLENVATEENLHSKMYAEEDERHMGGK